MPILNPKTPVVTPTPAPVQIAAPQYRGVTVDTKVIPVSELLTHVEGASWTVNYYSQVLDRDSDTAGQGLGTSPVHQQYRLIKGLELKVTQPLSAIQDTNSKTMTYSGAATVYPFVIPNEGDMFLASIGDGREGIFQIHSVERKSIFQQTCHSIEYRMVDYTNAERLQDFERKTVITFQYDRDFLTHGQNPLLFEEDYAHAQYLRRHYRTLTEWYFKTFFSREFQTMVLPRQLTPTYDPYITAAIRDAFDTTDSPQLLRLRQLNLDDDEVTHATSLWSAIIERDIDKLKDCFTQVGKVYASEYSIEPMAEGVYFSGIKEVVYPNDPRVTVDFGYIVPPKLVSGSDFTRTNEDMRSVGGYLAQLRPKTLEDVIDTNLAGFVKASDLDITREAPLIFPVMQNGYYILSEGFYKNDQTPGAQSKLEGSVRQYLMEQATSLKDLRSYCEAVKSWNYLDQFYLTPLVLMLVKANLRSL